MIVFKCVFWGSASEYVSVSTNGLDCRDPHREECDLAVSNVDVSIDQSAERVNVPLRNSIMTLDGWPVWQEVKFNGQTVTISTRPYGKLRGSIKVSFHTEEEGARGDLLGPGSSHIDPVKSMTWAGTHTASHTHTHARCRCGLILDEDWTRVGTLT